jgi:hypothetical protein
LRAARCVKHRRAHMGVARPPARSAPPSTVRCVLLVSSVFPARLALGRGGAGCAHVSPTCTEPSHAHRPTDLASSRAHLQQSATCTSSILLAISSGRRLLLGRWGGLAPSELPTPRARSWRATSSTGSSASALCGRSPTRSRPCSWSQASTTGSAIARCGSEGVAARPPARRAAVLNHNLPASATSPVHARWPLSASFFDQQACVSRAAMGGPISLDTQAVLWAFVAGAHVEQTPWCARAARRRPQFSRRLTQDEPQASLEARCVNSGAHRVSDTRPDGDRACVTACAGRWSSQPAWHWTAWCSASPPSLPLASFSGTLRETPARFTVRSAYGGRTAVK